MTVLTSSRLNKTPPMGAPKATDTPTAAAADSTYKQQKLSSFDFNQLRIYVTALFIRKSHNLFSFCLVELSVWESLRPCVLFSADERFFSQTVDLQLDSSWVRTGWSDQNKAKFDHSALKQLGLQLTHYFHYRLLCWLCFQSAEWSFSLWNENCPSQVLTSKV